MCDSDGGSRICSARAATATVAAAGERTHVCKVVMEEQLQSCSNSSNSSGVSSRAGGHAYVRQ